MDYKKWDHIEDQHHVTPLSSLGGVYSLGI